MSKKRGKEAVKFSKSFLFLISLVLFLALVVAPASYLLFSFLIKTNLNKFNTKSLYTTRIVYIYN
jgi:hypothetical protein